MAIKDPDVGVQIAVNTQIHVSGVVSNMRHFDREFREERRVKWDARELDERSVREWPTPAGDDVPKL